VEQNWGSAQQDNTMGMIANPGGSNPSHDPGARMDGTTVEHAVGTYRKAEKKGEGPSAPPSVINIGTVTP
jgi:hypothetical protein